MWEQVHRSKFRQSAEVTEIAMSMAEVVEARGEAQGLREAVTLVLSGKFGPLPAEVEGQIAAADPETLRIWLGNTGRADTPDEVRLSGPV